MSEPLRPGDNVRVTGDSIDEFYTVTRVEPFNYRTGDASVAEFSSVSTGNTSGFKQVTILEPADPPRRLYQVFPGVRDGCSYYPQLPVGTNRWGVDLAKNLGFMDNLKTPHYAKNEDYEFWLVKSFWPAFNASNATGTSVTPQVFFEGFKYDIKKYTGASTPDRYRWVNLGGVVTS